MYMIYIYTGFQLLCCNAAVALSNMMCCIFVSIEMSTIVLALAIEITRYTNMDIHININICMYIYIYAYLHIWIRTYLYPYMYTCLYICMCIYMYVYNPLSYPYNRLYSGFFVSPRLLISSAYYSRCINICI
jgi:hypothetical protein